MNPRFRPIVEWSLLLLVAVLLVASLGLIGELLWAIWELLAGQFNLELVKWISPRSPS